MWERLSFELRTDSTIMQPCVLPDFLRWEIVHVVGKGLMLATSGEELELCHASLAHAQLQILSMQLVAKECVRPTPSNGGILAKYLSDSSHTPILSLLASVFRLISASSFLPAVICFLSLPSFLGVTWSLVR